jgi:triacylglycerol lipase
MKQAGLADETAALPKRSAAVFFSRVAVPVYHSFVARTAKVLSSLLLSGAALANADTVPKGETVVLVHGLGRTSWSMAPLAIRLEREGFEVELVRYPSTRSHPGDLVDHFEREIDRCCARATRVSFVTHSLGGILVRAYLAERGQRNRGRVVMLAPPNRGSELVDRLADWPLFRWVMGPTALTLGTSAQSLPNSLPPADFDVGVIAGTGTVNPLGSALLPGPSDGTVTVESTRLDGMTDFAVVPVSHTFIMWSAEVSRLVTSFLRDGSFARRD